MSGRSPHALPRRDGRRRGVERLDGEARCSLVARHEGLALRARQYIERLKASLLTKWPAVMPSLLSMPVIRTTPSGSDVMSSMFVDEVLVPTPSARHRPAAVP